MKPIKKLGSIIIVLTIFSSCVTTQSANLQSAKGKKEIEIFISKLPEKSYEEITFIEASGSIFHSKNSLLKKLRQRAEKENADAIINVHFGYIPWVAASIPMVE